MRCNFWQVFRLRLGTDLNPQVDLPTPRDLARSEESGLERQSYEY